MAVTGDILATWRHPRRMMHRLLAAGQHEDRALLVLLLALGLAFVALWPALARAAYLQPEVPLSQRLLAAFLGLLALVPVLYLVAGVSHALIRAFGGRGSYFGARLALFWSLLAVSPGVLLQGAVLGLVGPGAAADASGLVIAIAFLAIWATCLSAAETNSSQKA